MHEYRKLGKQPAKLTKSDLQLATIMKKVAVPEEYDFDDKHRVPMPMFANDQYGDCVIAGRAHQTLRFELIEQGKIIRIADREVVRQYLAETGGEDAGLIMNESLNVWRKKGWVVGGHRYKIKLYSFVNPKDHETVKQVVFSDVGLQTGINLPKSASKQIDTGRPWDFTGGPGSKPGSWGGHCVYVCGYTKVGPVCVTWGQKQQMTWKFFNKYCDEAWAVIDALNRKKVKKLIDVKAAEAFLEAL